MTEENSVSVNINQDSGLASKGDQGVEVTVNSGPQYHGNVFKKLVSIHNGNLTFDPHTLRDVILTIDEGIEQINDAGPLDLTGIDISKKNKINNLSSDFFETFVELDFYPQFYKIDQFLGLKENQSKLQVRIDRIIKSLNRKILTNQDSLRFEELLLKITDKLIDEHYDTLSEKEDLILLILYYFYCNCCIGKKVGADAIT
ncbi:ABC-three component system protein [Pseudoteredinibacter isoporae]|uniref:ABC-three component systems C-terminal domain-containing protein n=1 Tax=Pseudoteredinibacter isoporae TaxID=570281 RepID=A0A7X0MXN8_9GAMM|nr:ABC-three component system protein [Pseudoteredinibacter isoporae]MBB6521147.1 hypothetical protein [Pseudoteredinibacter isoporae]NHO86707.1 hypothetical protein [Pseudoteredinibacter isoporae]NIB24841.1 hypothetical protein [Pseudoteredinibacter isoporae]